MMEKLWIVEERKDKRMYRRRCAGTDILTMFFVSTCALLFLLVCSILYGTRTERPTLPPLVREVMPAGRCLCEFSTNFACDTCLDCAANQVVLGQNASEEAANWLFSYKRDRNNYGLDEAQCDSAFPGQYEDIERAVKVRKRWGKVTEADLSSFDLTKGMVRAMIYDREVSLETNRNGGRRTLTSAALHCRDVPRRQHQPPEGPRLPQRHVPRHPRRARRLGHPQHRIRLLCRRSARPAHKTHVVARPSRPGPQPLADPRLWLLELGHAVDRHARRGCHRGRCAGKRRTVGSEDGKAGLEGQDHVCAQASKSAA